MFSLYLARTGIQSRIWFGGYSPSQVRSGLASRFSPEALKAMTDEDLDSEIQWAPLSSYFFWSTVLKGVQIGDTVITLTAKNVVYSSSTKEIIVP